MNLSKLNLLLFFTLILLGAASYGIIKIEGTRGIPVSTVADDDNSNIERLQVSIDDWLKDSLVDALVQINYEHAKIHDGYYYSISDHTSIGSAETKEIAIVTPNSLVFAHLTISASAQSSADLDFFENTNANTSTEITSYNPHRS